MHNRLSTFPLVISGFGSLSNLQTLTNLTIREPPNDTSHFYTQSLKY